MGLKKTNAMLGLLTIILLLAHIIYQLIAYVMFIYNPLVTKLLAWSCLAVVAAHAVLSIYIVTSAHDRKLKIGYPKKNLRTVLQRVSAMGIPLILIAHTQTFRILMSDRGGLIAAGIIQAIFFTSVFTHGGVALSNAFVTLGWLDDMERKKKIDLFIWILFALLWLASMVIVGSTYYKIAGSH
ncbi:MAG: hypothetical protein IJH95_00225 [Mogibacterium sp.]|nr:hypothetical protein [Mogibacterium sp.]